MYRPTVDLGAPLPHRPPLVTTCLQLGVHDRPRDADRSVRPSGMTDRPQLTFKCRMVTP